MTGIVNTNLPVSNVYSVPPTPSAPVNVNPTASTPAPADTVELSQAGLALQNGQDLSSLSQAKVRAVRAEIQAGTYESPQRIEGTIDRVLDVLA